MKILAIIGICLFIWTLRPSNLVSTKQNIDLPEEYTLISHNANKPDTLLGYYRGDILVIEFKH